MRVNGLWFDVVLSRKPTDRVGKLGVSVSKKMAKLAVDRNKIRRRVRVIVRELAPDLAKACHIKVAVKPGGVGQKFGDIKSDLAAMFQTARKRIIGS